MFLKNRLLAFVLAVAALSRLNATPIRRQVFGSPISEVIPTPTRPLECATEVVTVTELLVLPTEPSSPSVPGEGEPTDLPAPFPTELPARIKRSLLLHGRRDWTNGIPDLEKFRTWWGDNFHDFPLPDFPGLSEFCEWWGEIFPDFPLPHGDDGKIFPWPTEVPHFTELFPDWPWPQLTDDVPVPEPTDGEGDDGIPSDDDDFPVPTPIDGEDFPLPTDDRDIPYPLPYPTDDGEVPVPTDDGDILTPTDDGDIPLPDPTDDGDVPLPEPTDDGDVPLPEPTDDGDISLPDDDDGFPLAEPTDDGDIHLPEPTYDVDFPLPEPTEWTGDGDLDTPLRKRQFDAEFPQVPDCIITETVTVPASPTPSDVSESVSILPFPSVSEDAPVSPPIQTEF